MIRVFTMKAAGKDFLAASWRPYLTEERKKLADRKKGERERQLFLGAEVLLNLSLRLAGIDIPLPAKYKRNEHGKPYLENRGDIYVNWSHSGDYVICAVADREVGIDLQYAGKEPKESLVRKLLQPEELCFYEHTPVTERQRLFYEYWAVKESFLKAMGTGFVTPLNRFYVEFAHASGTDGDFGKSAGKIPRIIQNINKNQYRCQLLPIKDKEYTAALCIEDTNDSFTRGEAFTALEVEEIEE